MLGVELKPPKRGPSMALARFAASDAGGSSSHTGAKAGKPGSTWMRQCTSDGSDSACRIHARSRETAQ